ncbi:hypothetical protein BDV96DRAFT_649411 [Lophiotrema nucula]|uniref:BTB domain-containing protein n=1 Tax=Lophiotrema nucula TaxID=690887 RepID=A0A6A5Z0X3_9PLEO|nr:hypothetical protein BDV96DRAFT_649411 [Lophiotrema nucula]
MSTSEAVDTVKKRFDPPIEIPKCPHATTPPSPDDYGPMITVIVGKAGHEQKFYAHKGLLIHYSSYFRAALKEEWEEGAAKTVKLPEDYPDVFRVFFQWLMTGRLYFALTEEGEISLSFGLICETFVFGDARGIPELQDAAINLLCQRIAQVWSSPWDCLHYVYANTLPGSALRRILVDDSIANSTLIFVKEDPKDVPSDFLRDVLVGAHENKCSPGHLLDHTTWLKTFKGRLCQYHQHTTFEVENGLSISSDLAAKQEGS